MTLGLKSGLAALVALTCTLSSAVAAPHGRKAAPRTAGTGTINTLFQQTAAYELLSPDIPGQIMPVVVNGTAEVLTNLCAGWCTLAYNSVSKTFSINYSHDALSFYGYQISFPPPPDGYPTEALIAAPLQAGGAPKVFGYSAAGDGFEIDDLATGQIERRAVLGAIAATHYFVGNFDGSGTYQIVGAQVDGSVGAALNFLDTGISQEPTSIDLSSYVNAAGALAADADIADVDGTPQPQLIMSSGQVLEDDAGTITLKRTLRPLYQSSGVTAIRALLRGSADAAVAAATTGTVTVYDAQSGNQLFTITEPTNFDQIGSLTAADVNGDGVQDIVFADEYIPTNGPQSCTVFAYSGVDGSLITSFKATDNYVSSIAVAALKGTGTPQIIVATYSPVTGPDQLQIFDPASNATIWNGQWQTGNAQAVAVGDVNGDGNTEVVFATPDGVTAQNGDVFEFDPVSLSQIWAAGPAVLPVSDLSGPQSVAVADVFGTGTPDIVIGANESNGEYATVSVIDGATKQVTNTYSFSLGTTTGAVAVADVMGTGKLQIVAADYAVLDQATPDVSIVDPATGNVLAKEPLSGYIAPIGSLRVAVLGHNTTPSVAAWPRRPAMRRTRRSAGRLRQPGAMAAVHPGPSRTMAI